MTRETVSLMTAFKWLTGSCIAAMSCGVLAGNAAMAEESFDRGQALYENHCQACHEDWAHKREEARVVGSLDALRARVSGWSVHSGLDWGADEINDVTDYLNRRFYKLSK